MIKRLPILFFLFTTVISTSALSADMDEFIYYQVNWLGPEDDKYTYAVYLKKNDPCIIVENIPSKKKQRFCTIGDSGLDLERDYPTIYAVDYRIGGATFYFEVAAPWNEQRCSIYLPLGTLECKPTGN